MTCLLFGEDAVNLIALRWGELGSLAFLPPPLPVIDLDENASWEEIWLVVFFFNTFLFCLLEKNLFGI